MPANRWYSGRRKHRNPERADVEGSEEEEDRPLDAGALKPQGRRHAAARGHSVRIDVGSMCKTSSTATRSALRDVKRIE
jgi:hypothetical protein